MYPRVKLQYWLMFIFRRLKINHDSHEFILEFGTVANRIVTLYHQYEEYQLSMLNDIVESFLQICHTNNNSQLQTMCGVTTVQIKQYKENQLSTFNYNIEF